MFSFKATLLVNINGERMMEQSPKVISSMAVMLCFIPHNGCFLLV